MAFTYFVYSLLYLPGNIFSYLNSALKAEENGLFYNPIDTYLLDLIDTYMPDLMPIIPPVANVLTWASGPFALGFAGFFLKRILGGEIAVKNIFDGFSRFFRSFLVMFFTSLFTILWSLLLIIPGIIKGLGYSMAFYIMYDNPDIKPLEAIKESQIMMKGYKWKYFLLQLSFIGWIILASLTLGIGFFWLSPYMNLSMANFYENLKRNRENNQGSNQGNSQGNNQGNSQANNHVDFFRAR